MKLVDKDRLLKVLNSFKDPKHSNIHFLFDTKSAFLLGIKSAKDIIEDADTIDIDTIAELVKENLITCKDCEYRKENRRCWFLGILTRDDDFCSFAERKDEEE